MRALIYSNIYISLAAAMLARGSYRLLEVEPPSYALMGLIFCATLAIYNLDRLIGGHREDLVDSSTRHLWVREHRRLLWGLVVLGGVGALVATPFVQLSTILALLPLGAVSIGYCLPILARSITDQEAHPRRRLKELPGAKTLSIAVVWAVVTVVLPAMEAGFSPVDPEVLILAVERLVFIYAITLPFDVRDRKRDREAGIRTLAVLMGPSRVLRLAVGLLLLFTVATGVRYGMHGDLALLMMAASGVIAIGALTPLFRSREQGGLYFVGVLDGLLVLQAVLLLVV